MRLPWILMIGSLVACGGRTGLRPGERVGPSGAGGAGGAGGVGGGVSAGGAGGADACDVDGDDHRALSCGGDDCDDANPTIHPGASDSNATLGPWVTEQITPGTSSGGWPPAIAVDASSAVHLAYVEQGLQHATNRTGAWVATSIDPAAVGTPAIALDASGALRVAYRAPGGVYLATKSDGGWSIALVDPQGDADPSLALDAAGAAHLGYPGVGALRYAVEVGGGFVIEIVDLGPAEAPGIALDPGGAPHLVYVSPDADELRHAARAGGGRWTVTMVADGVFGGPSLAFDPSGTAHVSYAVYAVRPSGVRYAIRAGGSWESEPIDGDTAFRTAIALDASGAAHVAHDDVGQMTYAVKAPGQPWKVEPLLFGWNGGTLAVEPDGAAHVGYSDFLFDPGNFIGHATNRALDPDGIDQNCDGVDGIDVDGDGHASLATGGDDCDDTTPGAVCR